MFSSTIEGGIDFLKIFTQKPTYATYPQQTPGVYVLMKNEPKAQADKPDGEKIQVAVSSPKFYLQLVESPITPKKIYGDSKALVKRFMYTYKDRSEKGRSTGVMLSGLKGAGKTLVGDLLSQEFTKMGGITVRVNRGYTGDEFNNFISSIKQECLVMFDEFEKTYNYEAQKKVLTLFSGMHNSVKLFCLMVNDRGKVEENLNDRPDRLHYNLHFRDMSIKAIAEYLADNLVIKRADAVLQFKNLRDSGVLLSFDMVRAIVEEMNRFEEDVYEASQYIVAPTSDTEVDYTLTVEGGPIKYTEGGFTYTAEQMTTGPKLSFVLERKHEKEDTKRSFRRAFDETKKVSNVPKKTKEELDQETKREEFELTLKDIDLQPEDLVQEDRVLKRYVFVQGKLTFTFESDNAQRKDPEQDSGYRRSYFRRY